jgi:hypothetical protein
MPRVYFNLESNELPAHFITKLEGIITRGVYDQLIQEQLQFIDERAAGGNHRAFASPVDMVDHLLYL